VELTVEWALRQIKRLGRRQEKPRL
jgi:hypothetical protein